VDVFFVYCPQITRINTDYWGDLMVFAFESAEICVICGGIKEMGGSGEESVMVHFGHLDGFSVKLFEFFNIIDVVNFFNYFR
jgi:hypothetical protein